MLLLRPGVERIRATGGVQVHGVGFYVNLPYCVVCADSYHNGHIFELQTVAIL